MASVYNPPVSRNASPGMSVEELAAREYREYTNHRFRSAIRYLCSEGISDSQDNYDARVRKIKEELIDPFAETQQDNELYQDLEGMVDLELTAQLAGGRASLVEVPHDSGGASGHASKAGEAAVVPSYKVKGKAKAKSPSARQHSGSNAPVKPPARGVLDKSNGEDRESTFCYGGPQNETDTWHRDALRMFPFGETLYMQAWDSLKVTYDLAKSADERANGRTPIGRTTVPYEVAGKMVSYKGMFDSGSRFKLPKPWKKVQRWSLAHDASLFDLKGAVETFNAGGEEENRGKKRFLPRIFLEKIKVNNGPKPYDADIVEGEVHPGKASREKFGVPEGIHYHSYRIPCTKTFPRIEGIGHIGPGRDEATVEEILRNLTPAAPVSSLQPLRSTVKAVETETGPATKGTPRARVQAKSEPTPSQATGKTPKRKAAGPRVPRVGRRPGSYLPSGRRQGKSRSTRRQSPGSESGSV
ncbi:hypothetical protein BU24DRAFT_28823 [Aaosphaeria arxii CBS 175.79]|uniref:Uncharacterized protein n=1 Tax=Aaosphaeria arxii CBS 175.79 TaxID=1450172 RepID=A0A6A5Y876_9PLEO|nr:uncharacterized protein BU24DRAFT_28823 [Aaosphaeria arxii CBS 175.79]KAF2021792.1 hypothetical protein BU24DRAFT_28823 [Aaosphaeria arxii CBS 175.79]